MRAPKRRSCRNECIEASIIGRRVTIKVIVAAEALLFLTPAALPSPADQLQATEFTDGYLFGQTSPACCRAATHVCCTLGIACQAAAPLLELAAVKRSQLALEYRRHDPNIQHEGTRADTMEAANVPAILR